MTIPLPAGFRRGRLIAQGRASWFGGPDDTGVKPDEGLAVLERGEEFKAPWGTSEIFLAKSPPGTAGLARQLSPTGRFIAYRYPRHNAAVRNYLRTHPVIIYAENPDLAGPGSVVRCLVVLVVDWGPSEDETDKDVDCARDGVLGALGLKTGDKVWVYTLEPDAPKGAPPVQVLQPVPTAGAARPSVQAGPIDSVGLLAPEEGFNMADLKSYATKAEQVGLELLHKAAGTDINTIVGVVAAKIHEAEDVNTKGSGAQKKQWVLDQAHPILDPILDKAYGGNVYIKMFFWTVIGYLIDHLVASQNMHQVGVGAVAPVTQA